MNIIKQYLFTFYWASTTLSTAGHVGFTTPKNSIEILFVIFSMICTLTIYTYVLGALLCPRLFPCSAAVAPPRKELQ